MSPPPIRIVVADGWLGRVRGLIGRPVPDPGCGMLFLGESAVHGFGMRFPLDLVFLDDEGRIVACRDLPVNRIRWCPGATHVVELRAGEVARLGLHCGMRPIPWPATPVRDRAVGAVPSRLRVALGGLLLIALAGAVGLAVAADGRGVSPVSTLRTPERDPSGGPARSLAQPVWDLSPQPLAPETVRQLVAEGELLYRSEADAEALLLYRSIAELVADRSARAWLRIGNIHHRAGAIGSAIDAYRRSLAFDFGPDPAHAADEREAQRKSLLNLSSLALEEYRRSLALLDALPAAPALRTSYTAPARPGPETAATRSERPQRLPLHRGSANGPPVRVDYLSGHPGRAVRNGAPGDTFGRAGEGAR